MSFYARIVLVNQEIRFVGATHFQKKITVIVFKNSVAPTNIKFPCAKTMEVFYTLLASILGGGTATFAPIIEADLIANECR
jgi:hypothetical protein